MENKIREKVSHIISIAIFTIIVNKKSGGPMVILNYYKQNSLN
jgi:hypothetical protein